ncbi:zinc finger protein 407 [Caerostris extrusa]|uniref:Zinc finger protein 407 n=1 Tax=Caerostris extrusa TaxID=172846 RepID=A0AAV4MV94_CAEEX|nr:zinc finger protein 407 [Caerostris extrusa]
MDLDEDTHLCLRCGNTIEGLDNYVSHRQQQCFKFKQPFSSPFLSETSVHTSESLACAEPPVQEFPPESHDIYKLSASDFFSRLNLQYNHKSPISDIHCDIQNDPSTASDNFSSKLVFPSLENIVFPNEKEFCFNTIEDEIRMEDPGLVNEKWDNSELNNAPSQDEQGINKDKPLSENSEQVLAQLPTDTLNSKPFGSVKLKIKLSTDSVAVENIPRKHYKKKVLKKYLPFTNFSTFNVPRTSYRQKLNANDRMLCCEGKPEPFVCLFCKCKFLFPSTYLDHILICKEQQCDIDGWKEKILKNEQLFVRNSHFKCLLCSFYCCDSFTFLNHLKSPSHRQKTASLKNPLICLPCQDECSASDEMKEHFSKCHLQYKKGDHPIIITEKKKNLHCCYCLTLIKNSSHLPCNDVASSLQKEDISFITISLPSISLCACGVNKPMLNAFLSKTNPIIASKESLLDNENIDDSPSTVLQQQKVTMHDERVNENDVDIPVSNSQTENETSLKKSRQPIIAKITTKNGKFTYKKVRIPNCRKAWACRWCGLEYFSQLSFQSHLNTCAPKNQKDNKTSLLKSKQSNQENKYAANNHAYLCDRCPYVGKSFNQLTRHSRSHSGEKPFKCPHCHYSSSLSSQLK